MHKRVFVATAFLLSAIHTGSVWAASAPALIVATKPLEGTVEECLDRARKILSQNGFRNPRPVGDASSIKGGSRGDFSAVILCSEATVVFAVSGPNSDTAIDYDTKLWEQY
jgi:hypothetical protein